MNSRFWIVAGVFASALLGSSRLLAQSDDVVAPTVLPARHSASFSPYTASTTPLSSVPEGVTTYYWPSSSPQAVKIASVAPLSLSPTMYDPSDTKPVNTTPSASQQWTPVQTTLRPLPPVTSPPVTLPPVTTGQSAGTMNCVCQPASQAPSLAPRTTYLAPPTTGSVPVAGSVPYGYPPVYSYRPALPVSQMPGDYYFGYGLIGQPKVYVPGQPVRNALRYISP